jgi:preprotein translocase subunit SecE
MDSPDPRKRMWGRIAYVVVWIYVAALCLLALDQTFHWGIFGPKVPPVP